MPRNKNHTEGGREGGRREGETEEGGREEGRKEGEIDRESERKRSGSVSWNILEDYPAFGNSQLTSSKVPPSCNLHIQSGTANFSGLKTIIIL